MDNILHRIAKITDNERISVGKLETIIGASKGVLYKAIQKNTDIQSKWLVTIVENFPQYNVEWLLIGKGNMLKNAAENTPVLNEPEVFYESKERTIEILKTELEYKNTIIEGLQRENSLLWKNVDPGQRYDAKTLNENPI